MNKLAVFAIGSIAIVVLAIVVIGILAVYLFSEEKKPQESSNLTNRLGYCLN